ncbi:histidinol-phosphatase, partial [Spirillospora sp. NPDC049652]
VTVRITVRTATTPNASGEIPRLARLDLIRGAVTGPAADRDAFTNPHVSVVESFTPRRHASVLHFEHRFRNVRDPFYVRLRGTDGKRANGLEPMMDVQGAAAPWDDLWCYANPVFVDVR